MVGVCNAERQEAQGQETRQGERPLSGSSSSSQAQEEKVKRYYIRKMGGAELIRVSRKEYYLSLIRKEED